MYKMPLHLPKEWKKYWSEESGEFDCNCCKWNDNYYVCAECADYGDDFEPIDNTKKNMYVRCRYCDTAVSIDGLTVKPLDKEEGIAHEKVYFVCHACANSNESFVFQGEE